MRLSPQGKAISFLAMEETGEISLEAAALLKESASASGLSAIYGCGYNSCGCNLRLSDVRSGSFGSIWGRFGVLWAPSRPQINPKRSRPDLGQLQFSAT